VKVVRWGVCGVEGIGGTDSSGGHWGQFEGGSSTRVNHACPLSLYRGIDVRLSLSRDVVPVDEKGRWLRCKTLYYTRSIKPVGWSRVLRRGMETSCLTKWRVYDQGSLEWEGDEGWHDL
jgi:hypothetical protein